jgi:hypothetical protein
MVTTAEKQGNALITVCLPCDLGPVPAAQDLNLACQIIHLASSAAAVPPGALNGGWLCHGIVPKFCVFEVRADRNRLGFRVFEAGGCPQISGDSI